MLYNAKVKCRSDNKLLRYEWYKSTSYTEGRFYANSLMEKCRAKGIKLYMNTYNDQNEVNSFKKKGAQGFFTDFLNP